MTSTGGVQAGSMQRALVSPTKEVRLEYAPIPTPDKGQVLVKSSLVGLCGSDTHALAGMHPFLDGLYIPGHEAVGVVESPGADVNELHPGTRVILKPNLACGECTNCTAGRNNACDTLSWVGCDTSGRWPGAMANYFVAPATNLFVVPDSVDDETAALVECLATPVHAMRIAGDLAGATVAILGAGTIGALCIVAALHAGAKKVVITDIEKSKLARAKRVGAHSVIDASGTDVAEEIRQTLGGPADVVADCVTSESSFSQGLHSLRKAGTLLVVGVPKGDTVMPLHLVQDWEIRVQGCAAYTAEDIETALAIAAGGGIPTRELLGSRFPLADIQQAFEVASTDHSGKVLVAP